MDDVDPYKSHEDIEQLREDQEKYGAANTSTDVRKGATGGSWRKILMKILKSDTVFCRGIQRSFMGTSEV